MIFKYETLLKINLFLISFIEYNVLRYVLRLYLNLISYYKVEKANR